MAKEERSVVSFPPTASDFAVSPRAAFECTFAEFKKAETSEQRGAILQVYVHGMKLPLALIEDEEAKAALETANRQSYCLMLIHETARPDGLIDPEKLLVVTEREVLAGRMTEDDELRRLAVSGPNQSKKKKPWWAFWA
jgi:hypothetical protein